MDDQQTTAVERWKEALIGAQERFVAIADRDKIIDWQRESMFALQALQKNDFLRSTAQNNPDSLRNAIINVAACGITLNPVSQYAALVPRNKAVCLDIMYRGLIKIATDAGAIRWAQAELVHATDTFIYRGKLAAPEHSTPSTTAEGFFKDRGPVVGVYCVAKTADGDLLVETMSADEVMAIRDRSDGWKAYVAKKTSFCPWASDPGEMMKKTVVKRARKMWPESRNEAANERIQNAVELSNETDGAAALSYDERRAITLEEAVEGNAETIALIKECIAGYDAGDTSQLSTAAEAWFELPQSTQEALWASPTQIVDGKRLPRPNAPWTTHERDVIRSTEFRKSYFVDEQEAA